MTSGHATPESSIAAIKQALTSSTTCKPDTVEAIRLLLDLDALSLPSASKPRNAQRVNLNKSKVGHSSSARTARISNPQEKKAGARERGAPLLQPLERLKLATELLNITLKTLTEVAKSQCSRDANLAPGIESHGPHQMPLQPRSINRLSSSPYKELKLGKSADSIKTRTDERKDVLVLAECACATLAALRKCTSCKESKGRLPPFQAEAGSSALISKLLALGLDELASRELMRLGRRLEMGSTASHAGLTSRNDKVKQVNGNGPTKKIELTDLLHLRNIPIGNQQLSLVVTTQLQALRLLEQRSCAFDGKRLLKTLEMESTSCPQTLICTLSRIDGPEKAARQLSNLAHVVLGLSRNHKCQIDAAGGIQCLSAGCNFHMQILSLRILWMNWQLTNHKVNALKDIIKPLAQYIKDFLGDSTVSVKERSFQSQAVLSEWQEMLLKSSLVRLSDRIEIVLLRLDVCQRLLNLTKGACGEKSSHDEAVLLIQQALEAVEAVDVSSAKRCTVYFRAIVASSCSCGYKDPVSRMNNLRKAVESLSGSIDGDSEELDEMLGGLSSFRKSIMLAILEDPKPIRESTVPPTQYQMCLYQAMFRSVRFIVRYIGRDPGADSASARLRFQKRLDLASKVTQPFVHNVISIAKILIKHEGATWSIVDQALQDCACLADKPGLNNAMNCSRSLQEPQCRLHVALSNIYWTRYQVLRARSDHPLSVQSMLQKSVETIANRNIEEQAAGQLALKQERLGSLYEQSQHWTRAAASYLKALDVLIRDGSLQDAVSKTSASSIENILVDGATDDKALTRSLEGYCRARVFLSIQEYEQFREDSLAMAESSVRGFLLEGQLICTLRLLKREKFQSRAAAISKDICERLLDIYNVVEFPIRRLRCLFFLLQYALQEDSLRIYLPLVRDFPEKLTSHGNDLELARYEKGYRASIALLLTLQSITPSPLVIRSCLESFKNEARQGSEVDWKSVRQSVPDIDGLLTLLDTVVEFLHIHGLETHRATALELTCNLTYAATSIDPSAVILRSAEFALQLIKLGFITEATTILQKGRPHAASLDCSASSYFMWHLAEAEYFLAIESPAQTFPCITAAEQSLRKKVGITSAKAKMRIDDMLACARLSEIKSAIAVAMSERQKALYHARRASALLSTCWKSLERQADALHIVATDNTNSNMQHSQNGRDIGCHDQKPTQSSSPLKSTTFWRFVRPMFDGLLNLSNFLAEEGLSLEAQFYNDQATKISERLKLDRLTMASRFIHESIFLRSNNGDGDESIKGNDTAARIGEVSCGPGLVKFVLRSATASSLKIHAEMLKSLEKLYDAFTHGGPSSMLRVDDDETSEIPATARAKMSISGSSRRNRDNAKGRRGKPKKQVSKEDLSKAKGADDAEGNSYFVKQLRTRISQFHVGSLLRNYRLQEAALLLDEMELLLKDSQDMVYQGICRTRILQMQALKSLETDPVFSILAESTIASPCVVSAPELTMTCEEEATQSIASRIRKKPKAAGLQEHLSPDPSADQSATRFLFSKIVGAITPLPARAQMASSTATMHCIGDLMMKELLEASIVCPSLSIANVGPADVGYALEFGRSMAVAREKAAISVERSMCDAKGLDISDTTDPVFNESVPSFDLRSFQADYIDIIPVKWTAVSISLNQENDELRLCKLNARSTPFVVCIPLNKRGASDSEAEAFGFPEASAELKRIIDLANFSAHDAGDLSQKGAKSAWWEARAGLDSRLKDLLLNVENIWLGGFRGLLKYATFQAELASKFQQSFLKVLDNHLPSRRRSKGAKVRHVILDPRISELFLALGSPHDLEDSDESIVDLLYFVVDILQFNGERNAYDEIDFDPMVVEIQDALTKYHGMAKDNTNGEENGHTVLILDKRLHCFPWESLPCLEGQSVTRLPSLTCLRDRILMMQQQHKTSPGFSFHVDPHDGAYVLNPSGDLQHTQATLESPLSLLHGWSSTVNTAPTETDIAESLASRSLYLYFGHGSGGQYIRSRTIRKLNRCAVALLMGCSSGMLSEAGEFEPHGTPINYMHAGAPAVVGTLWDITDKDIDRFSVRLFERWGLFNGQNEQTTPAKMIRSRSPVKKAPKGKGRQRSKTRGAQKFCGSPEAEGVSLDRAVAESRDACILRYLNGAAPVIYGIPVSLS